jgi:DNA-binding response OmpR family regulator
LIADADDKTRSHYRTTLKAIGCDVVDAVDGRDALSKALSHRPSLVITETVLPVFDGYALCAILRRDSVTRSVPILVVTAETRRPEMDRARHAGADVVLTKPVDPEALLKEIQRLISAPSEDQQAQRLQARTDELPSVARRTTLARAQLRFETTTPPNTPPDLICPICDRSLTYERSHVGGVSRQDPEQWDEFTCASCGMFEYRQRTRRLRQVG